MGNIIPTVGVNVRYLQVLAKKIIQGSLHRENELRKEMREFRVGKKELSFDPAGYA